MTESLSSGYWICDKHRMWILCYAVLKILGALLYICLHLPSGCNEVSWWICSMKNLNC
jgi:hypothetical protein